MALASFLGIRMFPYLAYAAPLILTVYSLARLPQSPASIQGVEKPNNWQRISKAKKWFLQISSFVVIVVISFGLKGFVASHFEHIVRATGFPPLYKHTIVWILNVAIPLDIVILLAAGVATYVIWSRIGASGRSALIGGSLMIAIHLPEVSFFASLFVLAWVIICIAWPRLREKRRLGQTIVFVVLAGMLLIFSALVDDYIVYGLFTSKQPVIWPPPRFPFLTEQYDRVPTDSPIVWVLSAAISLTGGLVPYAIWRKVWNTSQKNALVIGHLMAIPVALWISGAAVLALITGLLVYVSPLNVKGRIAVQTGVTCLVTIALGFSWETAFVMFMALGLYIIWLYLLNKLG